MLGILPPDGEASYANNFQQTEDQFLVEGERVVPQNHLNFVRDADAEVLKFHGPRHGELCFALNSQKF